jgi:S1-C subfamily serine protease
VRSTSSDRGRGRWRGIAACLAVALAVGCGNAPDSTAPLEALGEGVARVDVVWWDSNGVRRSRAFGTAFRVGSPGELLTAHHVAANARTQSENLGAGTRARIHVVFAPAAPEPGSDEGATHSFEVAIAAEDPDTDLALLRGVGPPLEGGEEGVARLASARPSAESPIAVVGYPIGEPHLVVRTGRLLDPAMLLDAPLEATGPQRSRLEEQLRDGAVLVGDVETRLGNSGAPIYLAESREIIGLCSAVLIRGSIARRELFPLPDPPGATLTLIIAAQRIQSFLDAHRAPGRLSEPATFP